MRLELIKPKNAPRPEGVNRRTRRAVQLRLALALALGLGLGLGLWPLGGVRAAKVHFSGGGSHYSGSGVHAPGTPGSSGISTGPFSSPPSGVLGGRVIPLDQANPEVLRARHRGEGREVMTPQGKEWLRSTPNEMSPLSLQGSAFRGSPQRAQADDAYMSSVQRLGLLNNGDRARYNRAHAVNALGAELPPSTEPLNEGWLELLQSLAQDALKEALKKVLEEEDRDDEARAMTQAQPLPAPSPLSSLDLRATRRQRAVCRTLVLLPELTAEAYARVFRPGQPPEVMPQEAMVRMAAARSQLGALPGAVLLSDPAMDEAAFMKHFTGATLIIIVGQIQAEPNEAGHYEEMLSLPGGQRVPLRRVQEMALRSGIMTLVVGVSTQQMWEPETGKPIPGPPPQVALDQALALCRAILRAQPEAGARLSLAVACSVLATGDWLCRQEPGRGIPAYLSVMRPGYSGGPSTVEAQDILPRRPVLSPEVRQALRPRLPSGLLNANP